MNTKPFTNRTLLVFLVLWAAPSVAQDNSSNHARWLGIEDSYISLRDVKPTLWNAGDSTLYLPGVYCFPYADIWRLDEKTQEWKPVFRSVELLSRLCDSSFQVLPKTGLSISVPLDGVFGYSGDTTTVHLADGTTRPANGTYRLHVTVAHSRFRFLSGTTDQLEVVSPDFRVLTH